MVSNSGTKKNNAEKQKTQKRLKETKRDRGLFFVSFTLILVFSMLSRYNRAHIKTVVSKITTQFFPKNSNCIPLTGKFRLGRSDTIMKKMIEAQERQMSSGSGSQSGQQY